MSRRGSKADGEIVGAIDATLDQNPVLRGQQLEAARVLREAARQLSQTGRPSDARDCERRAPSVIAVDHKGMRAPTGAD